MGGGDVLVAIFLICISLTLILFHECEKAEAAARANASLSHCKTKCGTTDIHYPFGVKEGCYLDESFELTCNDSTGSASITWFDGELDAISSLSNHMIRIKNFVTLALPFNKSGESKYGRNFYMFLDHHYSISHTRNKLVAVGCDFYVELIDNETRASIGGCASHCNRSDIITSSCSGLPCCQINFLRDVRYLRLTAETINTENKSWKCGHFIIMDKNYPLNKINTSVCEDTYYVPVILEWMVGNTSCKKAQRRADYLCGNNTHCIDPEIGMGYRCACKLGFQGNPYLLDGCRDIDECEVKNNSCPIQGLCVNTAGSYFCLEESSKHKSVENIILGTSVAVGILILVSISLCIWRKLKKINDRKTKERFFKRNGGLLLQQHMASRRDSVLPESTLFKIEELEKATDKFSQGRVLGKGGAGTVYKGMLSDGRIVAVKKANIADESQVSHFINEVFILSQINHRHIVKLLGCCLEAASPLLVYEYVSNGTLSHHIHDELNAATISWEDRVRIAAEVAEALAYLHSYASTAIIHRDIKSSNILLDEKFKAIVFDFGLSRSVSLDKSHLTTLVGGTFGYLDPEYFRSGQLNDRSDIYAFGVVLAEILTGQKAVSSVKDEMVMGLAHSFQSALNESRLFDIVEKVVADEGDKDEVVAVAKLVKRCLRERGGKRPSMKEVAAELQQLRKRRELPQGQESLRDELRSTMEKSCSSEIDSETEN